MSFKPMSSASDRVWSDSSYKSDIYRTVSALRTCAQAERAGGGVVSLGSNDAILFGGSIQLYVRCEDAAAENLALQLPCEASRDYGKPFAAIFKDYDYDFYKIDPMLFAPAVAVVTNVASGRTFRGGSLNDGVLAPSLGA
jgi:methenyltetrahydromethanopterin cyclohydrolase